MALDFYVGAQVIGVFDVVGGESGGEGRGVRGGAGGGGGAEEDAVTDGGGGSYGEAAYIAEIGKGEGDVGIHGVGGVVDGE